MGLKMASLVTIAVASVSVPPALHDQSLDNAAVCQTYGSPVFPLTLEVRRITAAAPTIDGILDESDWAAAAAAQNFVMFEPIEGADASHPTEARVLYGDDAIYVGMRAFDTGPDSIVARLARRDERPHSDWLEVFIDSYHDHRTAFRFGVNPAGVKSDGYMYDDVEEDESWDAVWDVATRTDEGGWTAEFRIPYSQLRFDGARLQTWGINFARFTARHLERTYWAPISRGDRAFVSRFGDLGGLRDLSPPARLEVLPYSLARLRRAPGSTDDPFHQPNDLAGGVGADLKYGLTTDLTVDITINPDFGQVEADPAQVNLTAFETFFPERRPFFVEGSNIFSFQFLEGGGDLAREGLFYSRRIGRAPQGRATSLFSDSPDQTRILGAMKLSGKTRSGWTIGLLHALTAREEARLADASGPDGQQVVEPRAQYGMGRLSRDFREGRSAVGVISTWTVRDVPTAEALALHSAAYAGGVDARHRFGENRFVVSGYLVGSIVRGSAAAITRAQRSPARYFQRPDAEHTDFDSARTSLEGWAGSASFAKVSGGFWSYGTGFLARSPGFESNDVGFMREADVVASWVWAGYNYFRSVGPFQRWNFNVNLWAPYSFGGEAFQKSANMTGTFILNSFWGGYFGVARNTSGLNNTALRGGPMLFRDPSWNGWLGLWSDSRRPLEIEIGNNWQVTPENGSWSYGANATLRWRPSPQATVSVGPFANRRNEALQWIGRFGPNTPKYLFGRLAQTTVGITARADWTFTPYLSLQVYAQPFVSAGAYDDFKRVADSRARVYTDRFTEVATQGGADGRIYSDIDGDGAADSFGNPDFNVKQFRSTLVLRWEYYLGSTLFAVWSQGRDHRARTGDFSFARDLGTLLEEPSDDVFMLKLSYWIG